MKEFVISHPNYRAAHETRTEEQSRGSVQRRPAQIESDPLAQEIKGTKEQNESRGAGSSHSVISWLKVPMVLNPPQMT